MIDVDKKFYMRKENIDKIKQNLPRRYQSKYTLVSESEAKNFSNQK